MLSEFYLQFSVFFTSVYLVMGFFVFILFGGLLLESVSLCLKFGTYFLKMFYYTNFFSHWDSSVTNAGPEVLFIFCFQCFSLCCSHWIISIHVYWVHFFFCHLQSTIELIYWAFNFGCYFFHFWDLHLVLFLYLLFLFQAFYFSICSKNVCSYLVKHSIIVALIFSSDNSSICVFLV